MSKYNCLREIPNDDIKGVRRVSEMSSSVLDEDRIRIIHGLVSCPECGCVLDKDFMMDRWRCCECGTDLSSQELLEAIKSGYAAPHLSVRDLDY